MHVSFRQFTLVLMLGLFQYQAWAFDEQKPEGISDESWSSLKTAVQEAKLLPDDGEASDYFGHSVSLSGDRALIGAPGTNFKGAAYVFELQGGTWTEAAKLTVGETWENTDFGYSVSLSGNRALVGDISDDYFGFDSGSAYIFDFSGGSWNETAKLNAGDASTGDSFGFSVSLSGNRALISAININGYRQSAYVFELQGSSWNETAKLTASDIEAGDFFGCSVSLSGDRALIGAEFDDVYGINTGSAYVFDLQGGSWTEMAKLTAYNAEDGQSFGHSVSLSGDRALVGAEFGSSNSVTFGSAYVFDLQGGSWIQTAELAAADDASGTIFTNFGNSVSLSGDRALIGAYKANSLYQHFAGVAFIFELHEVGSWTQSDNLTNDDASYEDFFGSSVSLSGDRALIGAPFDDSNGINSGSAYVFTQNEVTDDLIFLNGFEGI